jgi:hypothetical protein
MHGLMLVPLDLIALAPIYGHLPHISPSETSVDKLFIGNMYTPNMEKDKDYPGIIPRLYETVETHLQQLPSNVNTVIGGDFHTSVGV